MVELPSYGSCGSLRRNLCPNCLAVSFCCKQAHNEQAESHGKVCAHLAKAIIPIRKWENIDTLFLLYSKPFTLGSVVRKSFLIVLKRIVSGMKEGNLIPRPVEFKFDRQHPANTLELDAETMRAAVLIALQFAT